MRKENIMRNPLEIRNPETNQLIGGLFFLQDRVKYVPIDLSVKAALRVFREAMAIPEPINYMPEFDELTEEEHQELIGLDCIDNIPFLNKQAY